MNKEKLEKSIEYGVQKSIIKGTIYKIVKDLYISNKLFLNEVKLLTTINEIPSDILLSTIVNSNNSKLYNDSIKSMCQWVIKKIE